MALRMRELGVEIVAVADVGRQRMCHVIDGSVRSTLLSDFSIDLGN